MATTFSRPSTRDDSKWRDDAACRNTDPDLYVLEVPFREAERLWYLGLVLAQRSLRSRCPQPGSRGRICPTAPPGGSSRQGQPLFRT